MGYRAPPTADTPLTIISRKPDQLDAFFTGHDGIVYTAAGNGQSWSCMAADRWRLPARSAGRGCLATPTNWICLSSATTAWCTPPPGRRAAPGAASATNGGTSAASFPRTPRYRPFAQSEPARRVRDGERRDRLHLGLDAGRRPGAASATNGGTSAGCFRRRAGRRRLAQSEPARRLRHRQ